MKRLFVLLCSILFTVTVFGQVNSIVGDTIRINKRNNNAELRIENSSRTIKGVATNYDGNGTIRFIKCKVLNDSTVVIGLDTLTIRGGNSKFYAVNGLTREGAIIKWKGDLVDSTFIDTKNNWLTFRKSGATDTAQFSFGRFKYLGLYDYTGNELYYKGSSGVTSSYIEIDGGHVLSAKNDNISKNTAFSVLGDGIQGSTKGTQGIGFQVISNTIGSIGYKNELKLNGGEDEYPASIQLTHYGPPSNPGAATTLQLSDRSWGMGAGNANVSGSDTVAGITTNGIDKSKVYINAGAVNINWMSGDSTPVQVSSNNNYDPATLGGDPGDIRGDTLARVLRVWGRTAGIPAKLGDEYTTLQQVIDSIAAGGGGTGAVVSVNGQDGIVVLNTDDIAEGTTHKYYANSLVQSFSDTRYAPLTRIISVGTGMTGGGDLTADRSVNLDFGYLDDRYLSGYKQRAPVRVVATTNITLSAPQTIDGISVVAGDRVLALGQSTGSDNGIYVVAAGAWARSNDFDVVSPDEVSQGAQIFVTEGTVNAKTGWSLSTSGTITLGTTPLTFIQYGGANSYSAGTGLTLTGTSFSAQTGTALWNANKLQGTNISTTAPTSGQLLQYNGTSWTGFTPSYITTETALSKTITIAGSGVTVSPAGAQALSTNPSFTITHPTSGVTAGTYNNVTVNAQGHVTAGSNAAYLTGNQSITLSGDVTGSGATAITATLASTGTAGTYTKVTTDAKGRVTAGTTLAAADIPALDVAKITTGILPVARGGTGIGTIGTAGQLARVNTGATAIEYFTPTYISANQNITVTGDATGSGTTSIPLTLANVGTAGTYKSVTVNTKGLVTAGTNPTTVAGYGITDAYTKTQSDANYAPISGSGNYIQNGATQQSSSNFWISGTGIMNRLVSVSSVATTAGDFSMFEGNSVPSTSLRWRFIRSTAEGAGNVGNNLSLQSFDNTGNILSTVLSFTRSTGVATFSQIPTAGGNPVWTDANHPDGISAANTLAGATVFATLNFNAAGHYTGATTRNLTPADIGAAAASGSGNYIQNSTSAAQSGSGFWTAGAGIANKFSGYAPVATTNGDFGMFEGGVTGDKQRWRIIRTGAESAGDVGNDFTIQGMTNAGVGKTSAFTITRSTGIVNMPLMFRGGNASGISGTGSGNTNTSYLAFYENNGTARQGYVGKGSTSNLDVYLASDNGNVAIAPTGTGAAPTLQVYPTGMSLNGGLFSLTNSTSNLINFNNIGAGAPTFTTTSPGTKIILSGGSTGSTVPSGIGIEGNHVWAAIAQSSPIQGFKWYGGTTLVSRLGATGLFETAGQMRATGWYVDGVNNMKGPAAEIGVTNATAQLMGYDRTNNYYIPVQISGAGSSSTPTTIRIDEDINFNLKAGQNAYFNVAGSNKVTVSKDGILSVGISDPTTIRASPLQVQGNVWSTDAYILGISNAPLAEFGISGATDCFVRTMGVGDITFQTNASNIRARVNGTTGNFEVNNQIKISGGTPGIGKVLTSDASGLATWQTPTTSGTGTVTSVGLSLPSILSVTGSPVTSAGTLTATLASQSANTVFRVGTTAGTPTFSALAATDIPALDAAKITTGVIDEVRLGTGTPTASTYLRGDGTWATFPTIPPGTVTSVGLSLPSIMTVTGSPVTSAGTITAALASQTANTVFSAPNGATGTPTFRFLTAADIPVLDGAKITTGTVAGARLGSGSASYIQNGTTQQASSNFNISGNGVFGGTITSAGTASFAGGGVTIGSFGATTMNATLTVAGTIYGTAGVNINTGQLNMGPTSTVTIQNGAGAGKVLTSNATGDATWQTPATGYASTVLTNGTYTADVANMYYILKPTGNNTITISNPGSPAANSGKVIQIINNSGSSYILDGTTITSTHFLVYLVSNGTAWTSVIMN